MISEQRIIPLKKKRQILGLIAIALVLLLFERGVRLGLVNSVSDRPRFHAIPVAISVLYHNHPHDYTGLRSVAIPFQGGASLRQLIKAAVSQDVPKDDQIYYWVADDRGFADFVIVAFRLFGPHAASMYYLWFCILGLSVGLFYISNKKSLLHLSLLCLVLVGVNTAISVLPLADEGNFFNNSTQTIRLSSVSIYEPRYLDVLAMVPVLHILLIAVGRGRPIRSTSSKFALLGQVFIFFCLYHARSSLGWQILAMAAVCALIAFMRICIARRKNKSINQVRTRLRLAAPVLVILVLVGGLAGLSTYKKLTYNPAYYGAMGVRTFWHNALMGLWPDKLFVTKYGLTGVGDYAVAAAVIQYAKGDGCPAEVARTEPQALLNSLGGHGVSNWVAYELCARSLYFTVLSENKLRAARIYLITKPSLLLTAWSKSILDSKQPIADSIRDRLDIGWYPLAVTNLAFAAFIIWLSHVALFRRRRTIFLLLMCAVAASIIPSIFFYSVILTLGGFFVCTTVLLYMVVFLIMRRSMLWATAA